MNQRTTETDHDLLVQIRDSQRAIEAAALWQMPYLNTNQVALILDMEPETVCEKIRNGLIPGNKPKGFKRYMVSTRQLIQVIEQEGEPTPKSIDLKADEMVLEILNKHSA